MQGKKAAQENRFETATDQSSAKLPDGWGTIFCKAYDRAIDFLSHFGLQTPGPHPDFIGDADDWYANRRASASFQLGYDPSHKFIFYFDEPELSKLDNCQFAAKFTLNRSDSELYQYIGFVYPDLDNSIESVESWVRQFQRVDLYTYGSYSRGTWKLGEFVRAVCP